MSDNIAIEKQSKAVLILNIILLIYNFIMAMGLMAFKFSRENYVEISNAIHSSDEPLMGSAVLDFLMQKEMSIIIVIIMVLIVVKEKRMKSIYQRLRWNLASVVALTAYTASLLYMIYLPILNAG